MRAKLRCRPPATGRSFTPDMPHREPVAAIVFDLDGLLTDSEPLWREAERRVFAGLGVPLTEAELAETTGIRLDEVVRIRHRARPWDGVPLAAVEERILDELDGLIAERGRPMPGALAAVDGAAATGLPLALASSSPLRVIRRQLERLGLEGAFAAVRSAEGEAYGKPHPAVYLSAAEALGVPARRCLALEDSLPGLIAAKAATMRAVAVPSAEDAGRPGFGIADWTLGSLAEADAGAWARWTR